MTKKTDNHNLHTKLDLRRYFLRKYHSQQQPRVFDCCQGSGKIWSELRKDHPVGSYWGVDLKPKKGRIKIDSERVLAQPGWAFDVIDVDAYGSPWDHWLAILEHTQHDVTVFLTVGLVRIGGGGILSNSQRRVLGIDGLKVPAGISGKLHELSAKYMLAKTGDHGITIQECIEAFPSANARYIGVRLSKQTGSSASPPKPATTTF